MDIIIKTAFCARDTDGKEYPLEHSTILLEDHERVYIHNIEGKLINKIFIVKDV